MHIDAAVQTHDNHLPHATSVALNDGKKWPANAETTEGIQKMTNLLEALPETATTDNINKLKKELETEFATILQKCTMTGEAHNQLHNYLLPMKELIDAIGAGSLEASHASAIALKQYLKALIVLSIKLLKPV